jgi:hypothetical protein
MAIKIQVELIEQIRMHHYRVAIHLPVNTYTVELISPHDEQTENTLNWYFEDYIDQPYTAVSVISGIREKIQQYGLTLFRQLFPGPEIERAYRSVIAQLGFEGLIIEIVSNQNDTDFQAILWETLRDDAYADEALVNKGVSVVRVTNQRTALPTNPLPATEIRLLLVTARPSEGNDVNYRTIQRPLVEGLMQAKAHVSITILRPGTFQALKDHLRYKQSGYYHFIHFDLHGEVSMYNDLARERLKGELRFGQSIHLGKPPLSYQVRYGREDLQPFEGLKAFLYFETEEKGIAEPASAEEVAVLIRDRGIPVCILNACQSARQVGNSQETNLAKILYQFGIETVIAMRYTVSVLAAARFMTHFYEQVYLNKTLIQAVSEGRSQLINQKNRPAKGGYSIELEDWLLPVIFERAEPTISIKPMSLLEEIKWAAARRSDLPQLPQWGFQGRDLDILKIEKILLKTNRLLISGLTGTGKTALFHYVRGWWRQTRYRNHEAIFYVDCLADSLPFVDRLLQRLFRPSEVKKLHKCSPDEKESICLQKLNSTSYILLIDHIHGLGDLSSIRFLTEMKGASAILYATVGTEKDASSELNNPAVYLLEGLDREATDQVVDQILRLHSQRRLATLVSEFPVEYEELMQLLAGIPRALESVVPLLVQFTVPEVLTRFRMGVLPIPISPIFS